MAKGIVIGLVIIAIGLAWLLNAMHIFVGVGWLWTLLLLGSGVLTLAWPKLNKLSFLAGTCLVIGSVFSILRQSGWISVEVEVPLMVVIFGVLFIVAQLPMIPHTKAYQDMKQEE